MISPRTCCAIRPCRQICADVYYEGTWDKLPDFKSLKPKATGTTSGFSVNLGRPDNFALRFEGFLQIAKEGPYQIHLGSDDGSRLLVDGAEVVRVDGIHPLQFSTGRVSLTAGAHKLEVEYFEQGGGEELQVEIEGPGCPASIPGFLRDVGRATAGGREIEDSSSSTPQRPSKAESCSRNSAAPRATRWARTRRRQRS